MKIINDSHITPILDKCEKCSGKSYRTFFYEGNIIFFGMVCDDPRCGHRHSVRNATEAEIEELACPCCGYDARKAILDTEGGCPGCAEAEHQERQSYYDDGYDETTCNRCNTTQWMLVTKFDGTCCECGEGIENENYDEIKDKQQELVKILQDISGVDRYAQCPTMKKIQLEVLNGIKNNLNRKIATLKKASKPKQ